MEGGAMNNISLAFMFIGLITGFSLLCIAIDTSAYTYPPSNRWKWLAGLLVVTIICVFTAIIANTHPCNGYTKYDYQYGDVPVRCTK